VNDNTIHLYAACDLFKVVYFNVLYKDERTSIISRHAL